MNVTNKLLRHRSIGVLAASIPPGRKSFQAMVARRMETIIRTPRDPNTLSNYNNFLTTHTTANFTVDFEKKRLAGNVVLDLKSVTNAEAKQILLDTSNLDIKNVKIEGTSPKWDLSSRLEPYGSALSIKLDKGVDLDQIVQVDVSQTLDSSLLQPSPTNVNHRYKSRQQMGVQLCNG